MGENEMNWFRKKDDKENKIITDEMSPLQAVTHLCACIQLSDGDADYEERVAWVNAISTLFPDYSQDRAEIFLNEAHSYINQISKDEILIYTEKLLFRIKAVLSDDQLNQLGPKLAKLIEADGIVMTSEIELANLIEKILSISITIDPNL